MLTRAQNKSQTKSADEQSQCPLHFRGVIAKPQHRERNDGGGNRSRHREPGQSPLKRPPAPQFLISDSRLLICRCRHVLFPIRNQQTEISKSILLEASVKRAPAQSERLGGFARVTVMSRQSFLDQKRFHVFQAHVFQPRGIVAPTR